MKSPSLEVSKEHLNVALGDMGDLPVLGEGLDSMLWESYSSLSDSEGCEWLTPLNFWEGATDLELWGDAGGFSSWNLYFHV